MTRQFFARQRSDRVAVQLAAIAPSRFWHIATFRCGLTALVAIGGIADAADGQASCIGPWSSQ